MANALLQRGSLTSSSSRIRFRPADLSTFRRADNGVDADATREFLYSLLLKKEPVEEEEPRKKAPDKPNGGGAEHAQRGDVATLLPGGASASTAAAESGRERSRNDHPRDRADHPRERRSASATFADNASCSGEGERSSIGHRSPASAPSKETIASASVRGGGGSTSPVSAEAQNQNELLQERESYVANVCNDASRLDVKDWVGRIFTREREERIALESQAQTEERRRRRRGRSSSGTSDCDTHETGTTTTLVTTCGRSVATGRKAPSLVSDESLVVHHGQGLELMSAEERLRAYLANEIPELNAHVAGYVNQRSEEVRQNVDDEDAQQFLRQAQKREVFGSRANFLRWQNTRRAALQLELDEKMPMWVWEAVQSWDQNGAMQAREEEVNETDLIFDYLTKRAAHINTSKLATEIPIVKTMHASYSLPAMWRDKYF